MANLDNKIMDDIKLEFLTLVKTNRKGYFISLKKTFHWLDLNEKYEQYLSDTMARKNFKRRFLKNKKFLLDEAKNERDLECDFIMRKNENNISFPWFSDDGFKIFCMIVNEPKSYYVRKYFIQIEKDYWRVLNQNYEETQKELILLEEQMKKKNNEFLLLDEAYNKLKDENLEQFYHIANISSKMPYYEELNDIFQDRDNFAVTGNPDYKILQLMYEMYANKTIIYVVNPKHILSKFIKKDKANNSITKKKKSMRKKKNKISHNIVEFFSEDEDEDINDVETINYNIDNTDLFKQNNNTDNLNILYQRYDMEFDRNEPWNQLTMGDLEYNPDQENYMILQAFKSNVTKPLDKYHPVAHIYILDKTHYNEFMRALMKRANNTPLKKVFNVSWNTIKEIQHSTLVDRLRKIKNKKMSTLQSDPDIIENKFSNYGNTYQQTTFRKAY